MSERLTRARSGAPTAYRGDLALHSAYDPAAEADRYAAALAIPPEIKLLILVEPCLGYLTASLRRRYPTVRLVAVHCSPFFVPQVLVERADAEWIPSDGKDCASFLENAVEDWEAVSAQVVEWRPAIAAYGEAARDVYHSITAFLRRAAANERTVRAFGRRWLRNAIRNAGNVERELALSSGDTPVVVAGAGPGLEEKAAEIARAKDSFPCTVIAVSSAAEALLARGIRADLVVTSDGGGWAAFHLHTAARARLPLAASLIAQLPSPLASGPLLAVADGSAWQRLLLTHFGRSFVVAPQRGTVTATAIDLALAITSGPVYVAGMDLANRDIRTHARPYALDRFREDAATRFIPEYTAAFERDGMIRASSALDVYAAWFAGRTDRYGDRLVSLGSTHPSLAALQKSDRIAAVGNSSPKAIFSSRPAGIPRQGYAAAVEALLRALETENPGGPLQRELAGLLLGGQAASRSEADRRAAAREAVMDAVAGLS